MDAPYVGKRGGATHRPFLVRFTEKMDRTGGLFDCWPWRGARNNDGYGVIWDGKRLSYAHRLSFEMAGGVIPTGLQLDHLCRNRACCNPAHLEVVTHSENLRRGREHKRKAVLIPTERFDHHAEPGSP